MSNKKFSAAEWKKILDLTEKSGEIFGLPRRRSKSVVLGSFNIRKLGKLEKRSPQAWDFLETICQPFDLLAVQEVMDDLSGIQELHKRLGNKRGLVVSDVTGVFPGDIGNAERLAFLFYWPRIQRTELASDITYDRTKIVQTLYANHEAYEATWEQYFKELKSWRRKVKKSKQEGTRAPSKPSIVLPTFLTFIRQPHCVSFKVVRAANNQDYDFLVVNAHLLYGTNKFERKWEFDSLIEWLTLRAKKAHKMLHKNILMMGDCNLEFESTGIKKAEIDAHLKSLNKNELKAKNAAKVNFPLLSQHPEHGEIKTTVRQKATYDQIGLFSNRDDLPTYKSNSEAGKNGVNGYDYGVFNFADLIATALYGKNYAALAAADKKNIIRKSEHDISDHMPIWFRLPL